MGVEEEEDAVGVDDNDLAGEDAMLGWSVSTVVVVLDLAIHSAKSGETGSDDDEAVTRDFGTVGFRVFLGRAVASTLEANFPRLAFLTMCNNQTVLDP